MMWTTRHGAVRHNNNIHVSQTIIRSVCEQNSSKTNNAPSNQITKPSGYGVPKMIVYASPASNKLMSSDVVCIPMPYIQHLETRRDMLVLVIDVSLSLSLSLALSTYVYSYTHITIYIERYIDIYIYIYIYITSKANANSGVWYPYVPISLTRKLYPRSVVLKCARASQLPYNVNTSVVVDVHINFSATCSLCVAYCMSEATYRTIAFESVNLPNMCAAILNVLRPVTLQSHMLQHCSWFGMVWSGSLRIGFLMSSIIYNLLYMISYMCCMCSGTISWGDFESLCRSCAAHARPCSCDGHG